MSSIIAELFQSLEILNKEMIEIEGTNQQLLSSVFPGNRNSASNLLKYLLFRKNDQRYLQEQLHNLGLSSLSSSESHIHRQLQEILQRLGNKTDTDTLTSQIGSERIRLNSKALFGDRFDEQHTSIMVTYESSLAEDPEAIKKLILAGMQVARINCAHDNEEVWRKMIFQTHEQAMQIGRKVKIYMDMAGPKIRTVIHTKKGKNKINLSEGDELPLLNRIPHEEHAIGCSFPGIVPFLLVGQKVYFDDGRIQANVISVSGEEALIQIERITGKPKLKSEKGINFPGAEFSVQSLTEYDKSCLPFIAANSDMLGYSFVKTASNIQDLRQYFRDNNLKPVPVILKIETAEAVINLPSLLLECMKDQFSGVMIARGDLALEIGFERLSEIQEEIIWICEAAHIPVIWATQVLESLNKSGLATRSEATDASMAGLADCVMINKGKNLELVLESLKDIMKRSASHRSKKRYIFRALSIAEQYFKN